MIYSTLKINDEKHELILKLYKNPSQWNEGSRIILKIVLNVLLNSPNNKRKTVFKIARIAILKEKYKYRNKDIIKKVKTNEVGRLYFRYIAYKLSAISLIQRCPTMSRRTKLFN